MKLGKNITSIIASAALVSTLALSGCSAPAEEVAWINPEIKVPDITIAASLPVTDASADDIPADEVVEVVDPTTGEKTTMTAAEAKASGKTIVSGGSSQAPAASGGSSAPSAGSSTPSAPSHTHSYTIPITQQKYVVDSPAVAKIVCNGCGKTFGSVDAWGGHLTRGGVCQSYHSDSVPEKGHYETITVGYKCSCGAQQ